MADPPRQSTGTRQNSKCRATRESRVFSTLFGEMAALRSAEDRGDRYVRLSGVAPACAGPSQGFRAQPASPGWQARTQAPCFGGRRGVAADVSEPGGRVICRRRGCAIASALRHLAEGKLRPRAHPRACVTRHRLNEARASCRQLPHVEEHEAPREVPQGRLAECPRAGVTRESLLRFSEQRFCIPWV